MKKLSAILLCIVLAISLASCGSSLKANDAEAMGQNIFTNSDSFKEYSAEMDVMLDSSASASGASKDSTSEKIIKTVDLSVQTKEYDAYISTLNASVASVGGYIENSSAEMGGYSNSNRYATYVVRIPADKLDAFLTAAGKNGKIVSKNETQQNVTLEYVDLESRISAYETEKTTLTGLLEKAESLDDVLSIQERLSEVNYQIESYTSQLNVLKNRVSYSTVTLNIREVERVSETEPTLWNRIKNEFLNNLDNLVDGLRDIVVGVVGGLPIIIPVVAVIAVAIVILRKIIRKRKAKKNLG